MIKMTMLGHSDISPIINSSENLCDTVMLSFINMKKRLNSTFACMNFSKNKDKSILNFYSSSAFNYFLSEVGPTRR